MEEYGLSLKEIDFQLITLPAKEWAILIFGKGWL